MFCHYILGLCSFTASPCKEANVNADGRGDESQLAQALSTSVTDHPSAMLASGQYSFDQSVNKSPSRHSRRQKIEREGWTDNKERDTVLQTEAKEKKRETTNSTQERTKFKKKKKKDWKVGDYTFLKGISSFIIL